MPEHKADTNKVTQVKLASTLEQVAWSDRVAVPGGIVSLEIVTRFVGNGAAVEIVLSDHNGKKHGTFKEKLAGNRFWAPITVPVNAEKALYADVKLPKHGISGKSGALVILPTIKITNAKWDKSEARRGDTLKLSADVKGAVDGMQAGISVWEHDTDTAHDLIATIPVLVNGEKVEVEWGYKYHEDTDEIPTEEEAAKGYNPPEYFFRVHVANATADSGLLTFKDWIEFEFLDVHDEPMPDVEVTLRSPDGSEIIKTTDAEGKVRLEDSLPGQYEIVETKFPDDEEYDQE